MRVEISECSTERQLRFRLEALLIYIHLRELLKSSSAPEKILSKRNAASHLPQWISFYAPKTPIYLTSLKLIRGIRSRGLRLPAHFSLAASRSWVSPVS
jgi:hypothetical protein